MSYSATGCNAVRRRAIDRYRVTIIGEFALLPSRCSSFSFITNKRHNETSTPRRYVTISTIERISRSRSEYGIVERKIRAVLKCIFFSFQAVHSHPANQDAIDR